MLMVMSANHLMAVKIVFIDRSVIFLTVLKGVSFGSVGRRMTSIIFLVLTPGVFIPPVAVVSRFPVSVAPVMFSAEMLIPGLFLMPVFSDIRPGRTCK